MKNEPLVSIIIPCFNSEKTIENTINSIVEQAYKNYEILLIDDASTDNTEEICSKLSKENNKIKYFRLAENSGGPSFPSNFGVSKASGQYIAFLDHDDIWMKNKLEKQISFIVEKNIDMVSSYVSNVSDKKEQIIKIIQTPPFLNEILQRNFLTSLSTIIIKKEVFEKVGGFDINLMGPQDWDFYINFFSKGFSFDYIKEVLAKHINTDVSLSAKTSYDKYEKDKLYMFNKYIKLYEADSKVYSDYLRSVGVQYLLLGKKKESLEKMFESIKKNPFNTKSYIYIPIILSEKLFKFLLNLKIKIKNSIK